MSKRTFLGQPGYGKQTADSGRALWLASGAMNKVTVCVRQGSLLASNFNALWCDALNLQAKGKQVDYFAMLHDDIGPQDGWLDVLIEELEAKELDVLGVAVPIKDTRGVTSIAIDSGDNWRPKCRLSMHEIYDLPETFTSDDVGANLLINTGCWVCKFDPRWNSQVYFTINDRIVFDKATGLYKAQVEPEDWFISRLFHEQGLKIGVTRKVHVKHRGEMDFPNDRPWGQCKFDDQFVKQSTIPAPFPHDVPGWLSPDEGRALRDLARGKRVLEIGSYCGRSTVCLAQSAEHVTAVDYFDGRATPNPGDTRKTFEQSLEKYGVAEKVTALMPETEEYRVYDIDFAFIDGDHGYEAVQRDIDTTLMVLKPDGLIAFHDYRKQPDANGTFDEGVTKSVNELLEAGAELVDHINTIAVVRVPDAIRVSRLRSLCNGTSNAS